MNDPAFDAVCAAVATACGVPEPPRPAGPVDWARFTRLVDRHHVAPLVQRSGWAAAAGAPEDVRAGLSRRAQWNAQRTLQVLALQRDVLGVLGPAGIDALVLKGVVTALDAHEDPAARLLGDVDLLMRAGDIPAAVGALTHAGLDWFGWREPEDPDGPPVGPDAVARLERLPMLRDVTLERDGMQVELHWRLFANTRLMAVDPAWFSSPRTVRAQGIELPALPLGAQWLHVLVHGSNHLWALMKWLADVPAIMLRHPAAAEGALTEAPPGLRPPLAAGLLVAEAALGRFMPPGVRAWAESTAGTRTLVRRSLAALRAEHDRPKRVSPRALPGEVAGRLAMRRDARYRLEELRLLLLSASRAQGVEDPGLAHLAAGPLRWTRRTARRLARR